MKRDGRDRRGDAQDDPRQRSKPLRGDDEGNRDGGEVEDPQRSLRDVLVDRQIGVFVLDRVMNDLVRQHAWVVNNRQKQDPEPAERKHAHRHHDGFANRHGLHERGLQRKPERPQHQREEQEHEAAGMRPRRVVVL